MRHYLLVIFREPEESHAARTFLYSLNAISLGASVWLIPNGAPVQVFANELKKHLSQESEGFLVTAVLKSEVQTCIHNYPEVDRLFQ